MNLNNFIQELKRRNVFRVATAYAIAGWLIIQVFATIAPQLGFPDWIAPLVTTLILIGFPITLIIAWAFELTPEGIKKSEDVEITESVTRNTGKKINGLIIGVLSVAVVFLLVDRVFFAPKIYDVPNDLASEVSSQSVAVLPFADLSEKKDQDWFSDGLTEEILNSLAQLPELQVTSRTSAFQFKGKDIDISIIADTLGVAHVVEGSVRRIGDQLRVTAQLIRADDGFHLWSETYDSNTENLFEVQTDIAEEIATTLDVFLSDERRERMFATGTRNVLAFQEYLKGMDMYRKAHNTTQIDMLWEANELFDQALELDPNFGQASVIKMDAYAHMITDPGTSSLIMSYDDARNGLIESLEYGAERIVDPALKKTALLNAVFFSDSWYQLPDLKQDVVEAMGDQKRFPVGGIWETEIFTMLREDEIVLLDVQETVHLDPLSLNSWMYRCMVAMKEGGSSELLKILDQSKSSIGNNDFLNAFAHMMIGINQEKELLRSIYPNGIENWNAQDVWTLQFNSFLAAALGQDELAEEIFEVYKEKAAFIDDIAALTLFELGKTEEARAAIRYIDSLPGGSANLVIGIVTFGNRLFFELEDAPNLVKRFEEANVDISQMKIVTWNN